ncbi:conserved hypothetical protein [Burkholderia pseudomallei MSHR346]|nr:conserved hypothetical protein [Burkholderia pseudomallei MSHR346]
MSKATLFMMVSCRRNYRRYAWVDAAKGSMDVSAAGSMRCMAPDGMSSIASRQCPAK